MKSSLYLLLALLTAATTEAQIHTDYLGAGHIDGIIVQSSDQGSEGIRVLDGSGLGHRLATTSRFLSHAGPGASLDEIRQLDKGSYDQWIEEQMDLPPTSYLAVTDAIAAYMLPYYVAAGNDEEDYMITAEHFRSAWWHLAMNAPDILRHKVAFALSELFVISDNSDLIILGRGMASYYDILARNAFGNYENILTEVSLHPTMGFYLSHLNNPRTDAENNIHPDENYAREIMQLFSIGLVELNNDGTHKLDGTGLTIPTYDNDDIRELAKVFTGLSGSAWAFPIFIPVEFGHPIFYYDVTQPMKMYEEQHEPGEKTIVGGYTIPAGQDGMTDVRQTIKHLFHHPNVAPFVSNHLIKRLIKSNPSPEYIDRVASVFNDNGQGVRGDLGAVIKAILLDDEARNDLYRDEFDSGRLREPIHRYTHFLRAFEATVEEDYFLNGGFFYQLMTLQAPLSSPTVFNFFLPDYQPNALLADYNLVAPEFQILNSATSVGYINMLAIWLFGEYINEVPGIAEDQPGFMAMAKAEELQELAHSPEAIVDYLDLLLAHGNLSGETKEIIIENIQPVPIPEFRIKLAIYLVMLSPDYTIMK